VIDLTELEKTAKTLAGQLEALAQLEEVVVGREAAALTGALDVLKPLLPHLAHSLDCGQTPGLVLIDRTEKVASGPHPYEEAAGEFRGRLLMLDAEGRFLEFEAAGEWSAPPLDPKEARTLTLSDELDVTEVLRRYRLQKVLAALGQAIARSGKELAEKEKELRARAEALGTPGQ
jgi:hypothetical protein